MRSASEERGQARLPTSRLLDLRDCFHVESLSGGDDPSTLDQLEVRKAGLPPLFSRARNMSGASRVVPAQTRFYPRASAANILSHVGH